MNVFYDPLEAYPVKRHLRLEADGRVRSVIDLSVRERPSDDKTVSERLLHTLHTHHGRDKLFKIIQNALRLYLWAHDITAQATFVQSADAKFTVAERNLMTITNTRRMFKVGRFVGEFVRAGQTLSRIAALVDLQRRYTRRTLAWLQVQMLLDVVARLIMCARSVVDDVGWAARKGFLHPSLEEPLQQMSVRLMLPVLAIDLFLNSVRLAQGIVDAATGAAGRQQPTTTTAPPLRLEGSHAALSATNAVMALDTIKSMEASHRTSSPSPPAPPAAASACDAHPQLLRPVPRHVRSGSTSSEPGLDPLRQSSGFSLLTAYDEIDQIQRERQHRMHLETAATGPSPLRASPLRGGGAGGGGGEVSGRGTPGSASNEPAAGGHGGGPVDASGRSSSVGEDAAVRGGAGQVRVRVVHSYAELLWRDADLRWVALHQTKLLLDVCVALCLVLKLRSKPVFGFMGLCGLVSGTMSVYRVWCTGR